VNCGSFFVALQLFRKVSAENFVGMAALASYSLFVVLAYLWFVLDPGLSFLLPYDLPALAFCAASLLCVLRGRWYLLCAVFVLATLNRETSYLIVLLVLFRWYLGGERGPALLVAGVLAAIWLALKLALVFWFWPASGGLVISGLRIAYNFAVLAKPWQWPALWPLILPVAVSAWGCRVADARPWAITASAGFFRCFASQISPSSAPMAT
jgi:hypothetical protein